MNARNTNDPGTPNPEGQSEFGRFAAGRCRQCIEALGLPESRSDYAGYRDAIDLACRRADATFGPAKAPLGQERVARAVLAARECVRILCVRKRDRIKQARSSVPIDTRKHIRDQLCEFLLRRDDDDPMPALDPAAWRIRQHVHNDDERYVALYYAAFFTRRQNRALRSLKPDVSRT